MSIESIKAALETALNGLSPSLDTAWENMNFAPPSMGTPWQECKISFLEPNNTTIASGYHREVGVMSVVLHYPPNAGSKDAFARAEMIRTLFYVGATFSYGGVTTQIDKTPRIGPPIPAPHRNK